MTEDTVHNRWNEYFCHQMLKPIRIQLYLVQCHFLCWFVWHLNLSTRWLLIPTATEVGASTTDSRIPAAAPAATRWHHQPTVVSTYNTSTSLSWCAGICATWSNSSFNDSGSRWSIWIVNVAAISTGRHDNSAAKTIRRRETFDL